MTMPIFKNRIKGHSRIAAAVILSAGLTACTSTTVQQDVGMQKSEAIKKVNQVNGRLPSDGDIRGSEDYANARAQEMQTAKVLKRARKSWVGSTMVTVNADDKLPPVFHEQYRMNFADKGRSADLSTVAARLSQMVGIPVRIAADVFAGSARTARSGDVRALPPVSAPTDAPEAASASTAPTAPTASSPAVSGDAGSISGAAPINVGAIHMQWDGTLVDFLNSLTDRLGLSWEYRDNAIVIMKFTTAYYELATYPNAYDYALSSGGGAGGGAGAAGGAAGGLGGGTGGLGGGAGGLGAGGGGGGGNRGLASVSVAERGRVDGPKSTIEVVKQMISVVPGSEVIVAEGSGRVVVRTSRDVQSQVRDYIKAENASMLRQVHIQMDIYSVITSTTDQRGVDLNLLLRRLNTNAGIVSPGTLVGQAAGAISVIVPENAGTNTSAEFANSQAIISALYQVGDNVQYRPISLIALNRQWARKARLTTTGYLAQTTPAVSSALGATTALPGLVTDSITTGDQFAAMPYVLENNTVMLKMGLTLSDLLGLFEVTTGSGPTLQRVQTPNTSATTDQYTVALRRGEVMAITGLSREISSNDERRLSEDAPMAAGGSRSLSTRRENFIVFVRAVIL